MKLSEVMMRDVEVVPAHTTVREAAQRMEERDVGALPVSLDDQVAGMVTDRDIVVRAIAEGDDPDEVTVAEIMTRDVARCYEDDTLEEASRVMSEHQVQRLMVFNHDDELEGIVSIGDIARAQGNGPHAQQALEGIKRPTRSNRMGGAP